ncbi:hypothetical protein WN51_05695 [Melipona quadrifasciata]|uniref:Uncharacterized protein n=1 Tax=Melipona quadrifasciata TaxID=166423 RepID=A0A0N0U7Z2_9HYME|nr:hypothetical protein WN51_05695 [Melipona quadrifasciata]
MRPRTSKSVGHVHPYLRPFISTKSQWFLTVAKEKGRLDKQSQVWHFLAATIAWGTQTDFRTLSVIVCKCLTLENAQFVISARNIVNVKNRINHLYELLSNLELDLTSYHKRPILYPLGFHSGKDFYSVDVFSVLDNNMFHCQLNLLYKLQVTTWLCLGTEQAIVLLKKNSFFIVASHGLPGFQFSFIFCSKLKSMDSGVTHRKTE